ncbi:peptidyl-prolyl cis-trans isomerase A (cyclophilin A) [Marchantia polymorpha subsp. ruderalis]
MGRIKPQALLLQSKKKKAPARFSVLTIMACNLVLILFLLSMVFLHRHNNKQVRDSDSFKTRQTGDSASEFEGKENEGGNRGKLARRFGASDGDSVGTTSKFAILNTTKGQITLELFAKEAPKTVMNFVTHSEAGYYNRLIFHRVIKGFMIQGGDPNGDGTGGKSIWGDKFEDEFNPGLKHEPFTLSMANAGPNSNGSQFFITTVGTPHLDNKHSVFGRVVRGQDVVREIEDSETDNQDRPLVPVVINNITIKDSL